MEYKGTLKFNNSNTEFVNPTIDINPIVQDVDPITNTISVHIWVITPGRARHFEELKNVKVNNLNYDENKPQELIDRVVEHLDNPENGYLI